MRQLKSQMTDRVLAAPGRCAGTDARQWSALLLRKLLGTIRTEPVTPDIGRPYYRALSDLDALAIVENGPASPGPEHDWSVQLQNSYRFILYI